MPDTSMYNLIITTGLYPETTSVNITAVYYLSLVLGILCLNSAVIFTFFNIFFYAIGLMMLIAGIRPVSSELKIRQQNWLAILLFLWPAAFMYQSVPLREAYIMLGICIYITGFMRFMDKGKVSYLIVGGIILVLVRMQLIIALLPITVLLLLYRKKAHWLWQILGLAAALAGAFVFIRFMVLGESFSPEALAMLRNEYLLDSGEQTYGNVYWTSYGMMLKDIPFMVVQFILSPLPVFSAHSMSGMTLAQADMIFVAIILLIIASRFISNIKKYADVMILALIFAVVFSLYEFHLTGAVRHRMPLILMLMIPASGTLAFWSERFKK